MCTTNTEVSIQYCRTNEKKVSRLGLESDSNNKKLTFFSLCKCIQRIRYFKVRYILLKSVVKPLTKTVNKISSRQLTTSITAYISIYHRGHFQQMVSPNWDTLFLTHLSTKMFYERLNVSFKVMHKSSRSNLITLIKTG